MGDDVSVKLVWHAFELNPDTPTGGENLRDHLMAKYGMTEAQSVENRQRITAMGAQAGFTFNFSDAMRTHNTFDCHRLLHWALESGRQTELQTALFEAYFTRGLSLDEIEVLLDAVEEAGLDRATAAGILDSDAHGEAVRAEQEHYRQLGVRSVPTFILEDRYAITGGQPPEAFEEALRQVIEEANPAT